MSCAWSADEIATLKANRDKPWPELMAMFPGRSRMAVYRTLHRMGFDRADGRKRWEPEEVELLRANKDLPLCRIQAMLNRSRKAISMAMARYGISRSPPRVRAMKPRPSALHEDLTRARLSQRQSHKRLCHRIGIAHQYLAQIECGSRDTSLFNLRAWCEALGLELRALPRQMEAAE